MIKLITAIIGTVLLSITTIFGVFYGESFGVGDAGGGFIGVVIGILLMAGVQKVLEELFGSKK